MTQQVIQTGTTANDGSGDTLRQAGVKINANFAELYQSRNSSNYSLPIASPTVLGGVKVGQGLTIQNGFLTAIAVPAPPPYSLPIASTTVLGGVKVDGTTITISNGIISSVNTAGASVTTSSTAPLIPATGDLWYDTDTGRMYVYFDSSWVDSSPAVAETISLTALQQIVAASTDFANFQSRIAAL